MNENTPQWAIDAAHEALDMYYADDSSTPERAARIIADHAQFAWELHTAIALAEDERAKCDQLVSLATVRELIGQVRAEADYWHNDARMALDLLKRRLDELFPTETPKTTA